MERGSCKTEFCGNRIKKGAMASDKIMTTGNCFAVKRNCILENWVDVDKYINKNGYVRYWDDEAKAPWLFNGSTLISYDDPESMTLKAQYVLDNDFGGVFYWEHKCDSTRTLLAALYEVLK